MKISEIQADCYRIPLPQVLSSSRPGHGVQLVWDALDEFRESP